MKKREEIENYHLFFLQAVVTFRKKRKSGWWQIVQPRASWKVVAGK
jgi:hypothetical protein